MERSTLHGRSPRTLPTFDVVCRCSTPSEARRNITPCGSTTDPIAGSVVQAGRHRRPACRRTRHGRTHIGPSRPRAPRKSRSNTAPAKCSTECSGSRYARTLSLSPCAESHLQPSWPHWQSACPSARLHASLQYPATSESGQPQELFPHFPAIIVAPFHRNGTTPRPSRNRAPDRG
jgi:hypothetical protein